NLMSHDIVESVSGRDSVRIPDHLASIADREFQAWSGFCAVPKTNEPRPRRPRLDHREALDVVRLLSCGVSWRHRRLRVWLGKRRNQDVVEGQSLGGSRQVVRFGSVLVEGLPT